MVEPRKWAPNFNHQMQCLAIRSRPKTSRIYSVFPPRFLTNHPAPPIKEAASATNDQSHFIQNNAHGTGSAFRGIRRSLCVLDERVRDDVLL